MRANWKLILIVISLLAVLWLQLPRLVDPFQVNEDFRSFYWMNKFQEPGLFPNDQLRGDSYTTIHLPWGELPLYFYSLGYDLLFYLVSFLLPPVLFSKLLPFILMPVTVWYLMNYGATIRGRDTGVVLALLFIFLNLASPSSLSVIHGLQRSFACTLMIALLYYLHDEQYRAAAVVIVLCALIYPPMFLLGLATWGLMALKLKFSPRLQVKFNRQEWFLLIGSFIVGMLILSPMLAERLADNFGEASTAVVAPSETYEHFWEALKYQAGGRSQLFYQFPIIGRGGLFNKGLDAAHVLILIILGMASQLLLGEDAFTLPREIVALIGASMAVFVLAWLSAWWFDSFLLYLPSRYTRVGLFLGALFFLAINVRAAIPRAIFTLRHNTSMLKWIVSGFELIILLIVLRGRAVPPIFLGINMLWVLIPAALFLGVLSMTLINQSSQHRNIRRAASRRSLSPQLKIGVLIVFLVVWSWYARTITGVPYLNPSSSERAMLEFISTLPKDSLIAGTPCALDNVPLFAGRQILFSCEKISRDADLTRQAFEAYYSAEGDLITDFCLTNAIDYLVIHRDTYTEEYLRQEKIFFSPYNEYILSFIGERSNFALAEIPEEAKLFISGDWSIIPCVASVWK